jgi:hypothetical protein
VAPGVQVRPAARRAGPRRRAAVQQPGRKVGAPGEICRIQVTVTAPDVPGSCEARWKMPDAFGRVSPCLTLPSPAGASPVSVAPERRVADPRHRERSRWPKRGGQEPLSRASSAEVSTRAATLREACRLVTFTIPEPSRSCRRRKKSSDTTTRAHLMDNLRRNDAAELEE